MDHIQIIHNLAFGFEHALTLHNLMYCAIGCVVGTLVGLLPGTGPARHDQPAAAADLSRSRSTGALIMLAGIYYGAQYGDSVSAITMKIPHASSIVACIDGYQMTLKGKTGLALFTAGVSSFIGGTVAIVVLAWLAPVAERGGVAVRPGRLLRADAVRLRVRQLRDHRQPAQRPGDVPGRRAARARSAPTSRQRRAALHHGHRRSCPTASAWSASRSAASASPRSPRTSTTRSSARRSTARSSSSRPGRSSSASFRARCAAAWSARSSASCPAADR